MQLTSDVLQAIEKSVLCWLATSDESAQPNVSPKEIFKAYNDEYVIIANIASPQSVKNIKKNSKVCLSFIDVIIQKGFQLKGNASIMKTGEMDFLEMEKELVKMTGDKYPFNSIIKIKVESIKPILAPSYLLYPEMDNDERIASAKKAYGLTLK